ncbi:MAG: hypothetical protein QM813_16980 [Verrucomicrobiota bacterium]
MGWDGNGTYARYYGPTGWTDDKNASIKILSSRHDTHDQDIATALNNCITRDNQGKPSSPLSWTVAITTTGNLTSAAIIPSSSVVPTNGLYLPSANTPAIAANTTLVATFAAGAVAVTGTVAATSTVTGTALIPSGATVPTNGLYLSAANTPALASNSTLRWSVNSTGNHSFAAPTAGTAVTINGLAGQIGLQVAGDFSGNWPLEVTSTGGASTGRVAISFVRTGGTAKQWAVGNNPDGSSDNTFGIRDITRGAIPFQIGTNGNVTANAPSSGTTFGLTSVAAGVPISMTDGTVTGTVTFTGTTFRIGSTSSHATQIMAGGTAYLAVSTAGNITNVAPSSGVALAVSGVSGTHSATIADAAGTGGFNVGYLNIPQNAQTANYTLVLADAGKHIYHAAGAGAGDTYTIPANGSVAFPIGTSVTFVNRDTTNAVSIAITTDTLTLAVTGTTGTRTLAAYGIATAIKVTSTEWMISGSGLS